MKIPAWKKIVDLNLVEILWSTWTTPGLLFPVEANFGPLLITGTPTFYSLRAPDMSWNPWHPTDLTTPLWWVVGHGPPPQPTNHPTNPWKSAGHDLEKKTNVLKRPEGRCWKISHDSIFRIEIGYRYIYMYIYSCTFWLHQSDQNPSKNWMGPNPNNKPYLCKLRSSYLIYDSSIQALLRFCCGIQFGGLRFRWKKKHLGPETKSLE